MPRLTWCPPLELSLARQTVAILPNSFGEFPSNILKSTRFFMRSTFKSSLAKPEHAATLQAPVATPSRPDLIREPEE